MDAMREEDLLKQFGVTSRELDDDAAAAETEAADDRLVSPVYCGFHLKPEAEENMVSVTLRMPQTAASGNRSCGGALPYQPQRIRTTPARPLRQSGIGE